MELIIHRYLPLTTVEGPGKRFCLWVQGCSIRCEGCGVPWTWSRKNGRTIGVEELFHEIKKSKEENGISFLRCSLFSYIPAKRKHAFRGR